MEKLNQEKLNLIVEYAKKSQDNLNELMNIIDKKKENKYQEQKCQGWTFRINDRSYVKKFRDWLKTRDFLYLAYNYDDDNRWFLPDYFYGVIFLTKPMPQPDFLEFKFVIFLRYDIDILLIASAFCEEKGYTVIDKRNSDIWKL